MPRPRASPGGAWDDDAFEAGVADGLARPEALAAELFGLRAEALLGTGRAGRGTADGLLIGAELAAARACWLGHSVTVVADGARADAYVRALAAQGLAPERASGEAALLHGFAVARGLT